MKTLCVLVFACLVAVPAFAQAPASPSANPITASVGGQLAMVKGYLSKSADQVPENLYGFEHYGNIVTYLRLNKMVPPSSQGRGM